MSEQFDNSQLSPYFNVDDIRKIRDFHGEMFIRYGKPYEDYLLKEQEKIAAKWRTQIEELRRKNGFYEKLHIKGLQQN